MKKICFITTISLTLQSFVLKTAIFLHKNTDWDITFVCSEDNDFRKILPDYIHYYPIKMERGISLSGIKSTVQLYRFFKREKFDLIQYSTPNASLYASIAGKLAHIPVRLYCQWGIAYVGFTGVKRKLFKAEEKFVCKLSSWIEPDSISNLEFAHKEKLYPQNKGSVIWNGSACGIDLKKFDITKKEKYRTEIRGKYEITDESFVYGFVGRITKDKGINELLESFRNIYNTTDNVKLMIVGPNEIDETINRELYDWSISSNAVIYVGFTSEVEKFLSAMDCYVLPSYREGFGMGVIEAEAMGVPVIVTNIPGPLDAIQENLTGLVVEKANSQSLENAMKCIVTRDLFLMGNKAHDFVKENFEQSMYMKKTLIDRENLLSYQVIR